MAQPLPAGQSLRFIILSSRKPFLRSRIHQSLMPQIKISQAHDRHILCRGAKESVSTRGPTWDTMKSSISMRGRNCLGCSKMYFTIFGRVNSPYQETDKSTYVSVNMPGTKSLGSNVVKHDFNFDCVAIEAFIDVG